MRAGKHLIVSNDASVIRGLRLPARAVYTVNQQGAAGVSGAERWLGGRCHDDGKIIMSMRSDYAR